MNVAGMLDSTLLKPDATRAAFEKLCEDAKKYRFATVCVQPCRVKMCVELLNGEVPVATVVGFPMGENTTCVKAFETERCIENGAEEIDMVMNIGAAKDGRWDYVYKDMAAVVSAAHGVCVKVILETCYLTDEEIVRACKEAVRAGVSFVKTSTGLAGAGATEKHVALMRATVGDACGVKAAGGVRTLEDCKKFIAAGANRIGTSAAASIAREEKA